MRSHPRQVRYLDIHMGAARHLQPIPRAIQEATASVPQEGDQQERDRRSVASNRARDGVVDDAA